MRRPRVAVVDYGIGNLHSARKAHERAGADAVLTSQPGDIANADGVVLPGVGNVGSCLGALRERGLEQAVLDAADAVPFLAICVGAQMLFDASAESPGVEGLGIIAGTVDWIAGDAKRPQMQWNRVAPRDGEPMFARLEPQPWFYFVHSLHGVPLDASHVAATCVYGGTVNAAFRHRDVFATQFHPEKSGSNGLALIANFVATVAARAGVST
ncbi:MAG: imidazole glycerol phosphate synthase subunit HisH [Acidimicrobiia bacterium]|nr:imidazole glycerol phosphate synthase subunit HisH [Acidimicrobiia bacterium]